MANRAFNIPNLLTYGRILAVPLIVLSFFLEGQLRSSDFARWSALAISLSGGEHNRLSGRLPGTHLEAFVIGPALMWRQAP
jgi:cardiolipin synthase